MGPWALRPHFRQGSDFSLPHPGPGPSAWAQAGTGPGWDPAGRGPGQAGPEFGPRAPRFHRAQYHLWALLGFL